MGIAEAVEVEEQDRRGHAAVAVGDGGSIGGQAVVGDPAFDFVQGEETAAFGEEELAGKVQGAGDVAASGASTASTGVLTGVAGV